MPLEMSESNLILKQPYVMDSSSIYSSIILNKLTHPLSTWIP